MVEQEYPVYFDSPESPFEAKMQQAGFGWWARLPQRHENFYKLLGFGLLHHCLHDSIQHRHWMNFISAVASLKGEFESLGDRTVEDRIMYWDAVKHGTLQEVKKYMVHAETFAGITRIMAGYIPDFNDGDSLNTLAHGLSIVFVWYEFLVDRVTTQWFYMKPVEEEINPLPLFYICMGRDQNQLYTFLDTQLRDFPAMGFPHYTFSNSFETPRIVGESRSEIRPSNGLALILNLFINVLLETPPSLIKPEQKQQLGYMYANWAFIRPLLQSSKLAEGLNFEKVEALLQSINVVPSHTIQECHLYPEGETTWNSLHKVCLTNYIRERIFNGHPTTLPNGEPIPVTIVRQLLPGIRSIH